jgi:hypothetical protein
MKSDVEYIRLGPIPSRTIIYYAFKFKVFKLSRQQTNARKRKLPPHRRFAREGIQFVLAMLASWLILNIYSDFGPRYRAEYKIYAHSDWGLQGYDLILLLLAINGAVSMSLLKSLVLIRALKRSTIKFGIGFLLVFPYVAASIWLIILRDSQLEEAAYYGYIENRLGFIISLVIVTALLYPGLDSFRTIKLRPKQAA